MERVLIDLSPLKSGGGVQLAYNFLDQLEKADTSSFVFYLLVPAGAFMEYRNHSKVAEVIEAPLNILKRNIFEEISLQKRIKKYKIDKIFTFFGTGLPHPNNVVSIVGVAYPIICYAESPYWKHMPFVAKLKQQIINYFRFRRLKKANIIFAETEIMKKRLVSHLQFKSDDIRIILPAPSDYINASDDMNDSAKYIFLSGLAFNKNLWRLYEVAQHLKKINCAVKLVISANREQWISTLFQKEVDGQLIDEYFEFLGPVPQKEISNVYKNAEALVLLSDLESFSNNHMESWKAGVPQIVSNRDFMNYICKDSALYCEPHNPLSVALAIDKMHKDKELRKFLVAEGKKLLNGLPTQEQRSKNLLQLIKQC